MSVRIVLLCEDLQTNMFVRQFLMRRFGRRFLRRSVMTEPLAAGRGSGEQLVRERFPRVLEKIRNRRGIDLIVVVDADVGSTEDRRRQLERACAQQGIDPVRSLDRVMIVIPRRNIETWFHYLGGQEVDETTQYPRLQRAADCKPLADRLHEMCHRRQRLTEPAPPSLIEACREYPKLTRG